MTETAATYTPRTPSVRTENNPLTDEQMKAGKKAWQEIPANRISVLIKALEDKVDSSANLSDEARAFYTDILSVMQKSMGLEILVERMNFDRANERLLLRFYRDQAAIMQERLLKYETLEELESRNSMKELFLSLNESKK